MNYIILQINSFSVIQEESLIDTVIIFPTSCQRKDNYLTDLLYIFHFGYQNLFLYPKSI